MNNKTNIYIEPYGRGLSYLCSGIIVDIFARWLSKDAPIQIVPMGNLIEDTTKSDAKVSEDKMLRQQKLLKEFLNVKAKDIFPFQSYSYIDTCYEQLKSKDLLTSINCLFFQGCDNDGNPVEHYGNAFRIKFEPILAVIEEAIDSDVITVTPHIYKKQLVNYLKNELLWIVASPKGNGTIIKDGEVYAGLYAYWHQAGTDTMRKIMLPEYRTAYCLFFIKICMIEYARTHIATPSNIVVGDFRDVTTHIVSAALFSYIKGLPLPQMKIYIHNSEKFNRSFYKMKESISEHDSDSSRFAIIYNLTPRSRIFWDYDAYYEGGRLQRKIKNAFTLIQSWNINDEHHQEAYKMESYQSIELELLELKNRVNDYYSRFRLDLVAMAIKNFIRQSFCNKYLQSVKPKGANNKSVDKKTYNQAVYLFKECMELLAPIMPNLYKQLANKI